MGQKSVVQQQDETQEIPNVFADMLAQYDKPLAVGEPSPWDVNWIDNAMFTGGLLFGPLGILGFLAQYFLRRTPVVQDGVTIIRGVMQGIPLSAQITPPDTSLILPGSIGSEKRLEDARARMEAEATRRKRQERLMLADSENRGLLKQEGLLSILLNSTHLLLTGGSGAGKTFLLQHLVAQWREQWPDAKIVVLDLKGDSRTGSGQSKKWPWANRVVGYGYGHDMAAIGGMVNAIAEVRAEMGSRADTRDANYSPYILVIDEANQFVDRLPEGAYNDVWRPTISTFLRMYRELGGKLVVAAQDWDTLGITEPVMRNFNIQAHIHVARPGVRVAEVRTGDGIPYGGFRVPNLAE